MIWGISGIVVGSEGGYTSNVSSRYGLWLLSQARGEDYKDTTRPEHSGGTHKWRNTEKRRGLECYISRIVIFCFFVKILDVFYQIYFVLYRNRSRLLWYYRNGLETWGIANLFYLDFCYGYHTYVFVLNDFGYTLFNEYNFLVVVKKRQKKLKNNKVKSTNTLEITKIHH